MASAIERIIEVAGQNFDSPECRVNNPRITARESIELADYIVALRAERDALAAQVDVLEKWRNLALQFDGQRMQAMGLLKMIATGHFDMRVIQKFVADTPASGDAHLAEIRAEAVKDFAKALSNTVQIPNGPMTRVDYYKAAIRHAIQFAEQYAAKLRQGGE